MSSNKYLNRLLVLNSELDTANTESISNYFYSLIDMVNEIGKDDFVYGSKIDLLANIIKNPTVISASKLTGKTKSEKNKLVPIIKDLETKVFSIMLNSYTIFERDSASFDNLVYLMRKNIFLSKITDKDFVLTYPTIIKNIYEGSLDTALKSICETFTEPLSPSLNNSVILNNLLTYLSAALELPDVYLYAKKMGLELAVLKHDYSEAHNIVNDLEDMHYSNNDLKYYKALIKQKNKPHILKRIPN